MTISFDSVAHPVAVDKSGTDIGTGKGAVDPFQQYRFAQPDTACKGTMLAGGEISVDDIKKQIENYLKHGHDGATPPAESQHGDDKPLYPDLMGQPVYGENTKAITDTVEKYGAKLDYRQKKDLDDMISATSLGETDKLKQAFESSTPETRQAYADVMKKELGLDVTLTNKDNGGFDLTIYRNQGLEKIEISRNEQYGETNIASGWMNGKAPMHVDPWVMSSDRQTVNNAMSSLSDSADKYRIQVGETR